MQTSTTNKKTTGPFKPDGSAVSSSRLQNDANENTEEEAESMDNINEQLSAFWKETKSNQDFEKAFDSTMALVSQQIEDLIRTGLDAFHRWENTSRELSLLRDEYKGKETEFERVRAAEEKSRATVSNLLRALEASRAEARENARAAVSEAGLRAELSFMTSQRDEALAQAEESKRKASLLQEELRVCKTKLSRATQEKLKMERDQRATLSLAKSLDSQGPVDVDYYKRKVSELSNHVQSTHAIIAEKNRQIDEMRRQIERNMSQNRLANLRRDLDKTSSRKRPHT